MAQNKFLRQIIKVMQGKALIKFFTGVALLVVAYQFLLWFPTRSVETNADQYASASVSEMADSNEKEERRDSFRNAYLDSVSNKPVFTIPLVKSYNYQELKQQQIAWGLDLQGGMSVVMQVDLKELIIVLSGNSSNPEFLKALDLAKVAQQSAQTDYVTLFGEEYAKLTDQPKKVYNYRTLFLLVHDIDFVQSSEGTCLQL